MPTLDMEEPTMSPKILIIDDEPGIAKIVRMTAQKLGMECRSLTDSVGAVEVFKEYRPDVVLLDMIMPGKDGIDVLNDMLATGIPTRIALISGYGDGYLRLAERVAVFHHSKELPILRKPFRTAELVDLLTRLVSGVEGEPLLPSA
jgi:two-component system response regulator MtrA